MNFLILITAALFSPLVRSTDTADLRDPCGPCYVDASAVQIEYWATSVITVNGYYQASSTVNLTSTTVTVANLSACGTATGDPIDRRALASAFPADSNIAAPTPRYSTVIGTQTQHFYQTSVVDSSTLISGAILDYSTAYIAYTSLDVYAQAMPTEGSVGSYSCPPRKSYAISLDSPIYVAATQGNANYATLTSVGPVPMQTALIQNLQADTSLIQKYPDLVSCAAGLEWGQPTVLIPLTTGHNASCPNSIASSAVPATTKSAGAALVNPSLKPYVEPKAQALPARVTPTGSSASATPPPNGKSQAPAATNAIAQVSPQAVSNGNSQATAGTNLNAPASPQAVSNENSQTPASKSITNIPGVTQTRAEVSQGNTQSNPAKSQADSASNKQTSAGSNTQNSLPSGQSSIASGDKTQSSGMGTPSASGSLTTPTAGAATITVASSASIPATGSLETVTLQSTTITGRVVSASNSVVVLSVPTNSGQETTGATTTGASASTATGAANKSKVDRLIYLLSCVGLLMVFVF